MEIEKIHINQPIYRLTSPGGIQGLSYLEYEVVGIIRKSATQFELVVSRNLSVETIIYYSDIPLLSDRFFFTLEELSSRYLEDTLDEIESLEDKIRSIRRVNYKLLNQKPQV